LCKRGTQLVGVSSIKVTMNLEYVESMFRVCVCVMVVLAYVGSRYNLAVYETLS